MDKTLKLYRAQAYRYRFLILWVAFLLEFIMPSFEDEVRYYHLIDLLIFIFGILAGFNVLLARRKLFFLIIVLGAFTVSVRLINDDVLPIWVEYLRDFTLITYYVIIVYEIFKELVDQKKVDLNTIGAVLAGFFVIGIIGGVVFSVIENLIPHSFSGLEISEKPIDRLIYFSFITLTTIGYGDISPVTQLAQRVTVLFGLMGNFYSTIVIGIIISKFLANKNK